ncbi:MAG: NAD(P)/FAD-dependent oxidoreductase [Planctomycetaceae bacterium]|nr:NAD(P)/FAD-dependent oxidoreductase [Planctomycetaceae bacterium]
MPSATQHATTSSDVIVIGGGAAGLLAATAAAENDKQVLLLEKNSKAGVKILMSGGTRCNITQATDRRGIVTAFGAQGNFLHSALAALSPDDLVDLFESEGVATKIEPTGKIFPVSDRAIDVRDALLRRLHRSGARLALNSAVHAFRRTQEGFEVSSTSGQFQCKKLILTVGGQSYPGCGTTGDGYAWAKSMGHAIVPPRPALVPITTNSTWIHELRGITMEDVSLKIEQPAADGKQKEIAHRRGSMVLTHFGLSGPVVLDISRVITQAANRKNLVLKCDFLPGLSEKETEQQLERLCRRDGGRLIHQTLSSLSLPKRLIEQLIISAAIPDERRVAELSRQERGRLIRAIKTTTIDVAGTLGFKKAEVTAGGVSRDEVDSRNMQSKLVAGLYFAGEILDLDGPIGGYNFQAAFSTGWLAGISV